MKRPKQMVDLYCESASDYRITQVDGTYEQTITVERARELLANGNVGDFNLALRRLVEFDFDVEKLKTYYESKRVADGQRRSA